MNEKNLSDIHICGHCGNVSAMEIIAKGETAIGSDNFFYEYLILDCPNCEKVNLFSYEWYEGKTEKGIHKLLYPIGIKCPQGVPTKIVKAFNIAEKVKQIDPDLYAIQARKILELICADKDKGAIKGDLNEKLKALALNDKIPDKLVKVAEKLRYFGNTGAHPAEGELTKEEIPTINALLLVILEYIYGAPYLTDQAEIQLKRIKKS